MAIDYTIDYTCTPKDTLSTEGILERMKGLERARQIIRLFREHDDNRPPSEMGFEFTRSTPEGEEETRVIVVQDLLDAADDLKPLERHCQGCPANANGGPFGCMNFIQYPISSAGEAWLLNQLPVPDEPLVWLLLRQGVENFHYDGQTVAPLRSESDAYFEDRTPARRRLGEFDIDANQVFEMIFTVGDIAPNHAGVLLLFFNAINRDLEAEDIMAISSLGAMAADHHAFQLRPAPTDDRTVAELKAFFYALYIAWRYQVKLLVDA